VQNSVCHWEIYDTTPLSPYQKLVGGRGWMDSGGGPEAISVVSFLAFSLDCCKQVISK